MGDISADALGPARRVVLEKLMGVYPPEVKDAAGELLEKAKRSLEKLLERAAGGEPLRVWTGAAPDESCGLCWLMDRLSAAGLESADVTVVTLPDFEEREDRTVVRYSGWGDVSPYRWGRMAELGRRLPAALVRASAGRWAQLRRENAPLRAVLNGQPVSVPEDFYDSFILRELDKRDAQFSEAALIGDVLGKYRLGIGDAWLAMRIEAFISRGLLRPVTVPEGGGPVYRRTLCKCD